MNAIARHQNWREKRNNSTHSAFWRASYQHQTLASTLAPCARYLSTCTCSLGHIRCHHSANSFHAKWVQTTPTSTQHHTLTMTAVSLASPREAEGIPPWSFVKAPQFGPTSRWHAQSSGCAWETKSEMVIRVFSSKLCAQTHVQVMPRGSQWVVNDPLPFL